MSELNLPESPKEWGKTFIVGLLMSGVLWLGNTVVELKQSQDNGPLAREFRNAEMNDIHARLIELERRCH